MAALLVLGLLVTAAGIALDAAPIQEFLIANLTSRSLGSLAPGYASTAGGYRVYSGLVRAFGTAVFGLWAASLFPLGVVFVVIGIVAFAYYTVRAIRGEIVTYRALKR